MPYSNGEKLLVRFTNKNEWTLIFNNKEEIAYWLKNNIIISLQIFDIDVE